MRQQFKSRLIALCIVSAVLPLSGNAARTPEDSGPVQSTWKPQEIHYSYVGFTTAYNCDAAEEKLKNILLALGAHPQTKVRAAGCRLDRPSRNFFITITTATPVAVTDGTTASPDQSQQELIKRLGVKSSITSDQFPAAWKTVDLSSDRKLDLQPGDCELMQGLRDRVLPSLSVRIIADSVQCTPKQLSIQTPELKVSALMPAVSPDKAKPVT